MTAEDINQPQPPDGQVLIYEEGGARLRVRLDGHTVWLSQRLIAELYQVSVKTVNEHLKNIYEEGELGADPTIRNFRIVQNEGSRTVARDVDHYNLEAIIAVGYRVRSQRGTAFRRWATAQIRDLLEKGFVLDDDRLKAGKSIGADYFEELLERIRDIRSAERRFHQKITDIFATSIDYDPSHSISRAFFATVQNKLHWAAHGHTAAEIIVQRADASKPNMGLTTWKNAPRGPIRPADVAIAKNYLTELELRALNRIVTMYLDYAEDQANRRKAMHMSDWADRLNAFLSFNEREILEDAGRVSHEVAERLSRTEFEKYNRSRLQNAQEAPRQGDELERRVREVISDDHPSNKQSR